ncbi:uncharacterized protein LOC110704331 [Chenopodium quinoa]|uniref:uncharacterized protein LOC110704331 n=1 Tax=Chenopodium quinoa TaxID=63459 RepID=UPI000B7805CF|nr:uncharacterized protein LOC110704331 [Chenopodium quinoa]
MAIATRIAMTAASSISSLISVHCHNFDFRNPRYSSSSSAASADYASSSNRKTKKSNQTDRLSAVIDAANDRKLPPELRGQRNNVRSETDIVNIVEKRIWQFMEEGHFEKLPGKGKPLNLSTNPHAAPDEDTLYRILSKNGCAPEWVELNKQIRSDAVEWRSALKKAWAYKVNGNVAKWTECSEALKAEMGAINNKVFRYNLVVPFGRQMFGIKWEKELECLKES